MQVILSEIIRKVIELPFLIMLFIMDTIRDSPIIQQFCTRCIDVMIYISQQIVQDPIIQEHIATTIAIGMNIFIQQPNFDQLLLHMVTSISKSQPDIARQHGQDFPIIVSSFVQGILNSGNNNNKSTNHKNNNNNNTTTTKSNETQQQQLHEEHKPFIVPSPSKKIRNDLDNISKEKYIDVVGVNESGAGVDRNNTTRHIQKPVIVPVLPTTPIPTTIVSPTPTSSSSVDASEDITINKQNNEPVNGDVSSPCLVTIPLDEGIESITKSAGNSDQNRKGDPDTISDLNIPSLSMDPTATTTTTKTTTALIDDGTVHDKLPTLNDDIVIVQQQHQSNQELAITSTSSTSSFDNMDTGDTTTTKSSNTNSIIFPFSLFGNKNNKNQ